MKLSQDQRETLQALDKEQWSAITAYCAQVTAQMGERVLSLTPEADPRMLVIEKSKYDGAQAIVNAIIRAPKALKEK